MFARPIAATNETREERIEAIMKELRPKIDAAVRKMVERAVDVPEAEEFGAIDFEFRDAGQKLANDVRQVSVTSRKRGVRRLQHDVSVLRTDWGRGRAHRKSPRWDPCQPGAA